MNIAEIADAMRDAVARSNFTDSLKFDCGADGVLVIADKAISLVDADADCTLSLSLDNLEKLIKGKLNPMTAVMMGKLKVGGNPTVALKLKELL